MSTQTQTQTLPEGWIALGNGWTVTTESDEDPNFELAWSCTKGNYQQNLMSGCESLSGSTLKGKARDYGGRYAASRAKLFARMKEKGVVFSTRTIGKRNILCIGAWPQ